MTPNEEEKVARYIVLKRVAPGDGSTWRELGSVEAHGPAEAAKAASRYEAEGAAGGEYRVAPARNWRRVDVAVITEPVLRAKESPGVPEVPSNGGPAVASAKEPAPAV